MTPPALAGLLALTLSLGTGPASAAAADPSERDVAYERGVQAETAGDDEQAAAAYERAFRLTSPAESGPRLLFLRASVAARLRADAGGEPGRVQLCHASDLLREYLGDTPAPVGQDPLAEERASLQAVEQRLGSAGPSCASLLGGGVSEPPAPEPTPPTPTTTTPTTSPIAEPEPAAPASGPSPGPTPIDPRRRALRISGGVSLGVGAAGLAMMVSGLAIGRRAIARGQRACLEEMACEAFSPELRDIQADGTRGDVLATVGAVVGGVGVITGAVLLIVGERTRGRARATLSPAWTPTWTGVTLSGRF